MKSFKIAKYQFMDSTMAMGIFYAILLALTILGVIITLNSNAQSNTTGLDIAPMIFLFVVGLNSFKSIFKFSQANNVSRKTFFKGMFMGLTPVAMIMAIVGVFISRIFNIFQSSSTAYDLIYGTSKGFSFANLESLSLTQNNSILAIIGNIIFQFALYVMILSFGILVSLIYYRCNKLLRVIVSFIPFILLIFSYNIFKLFPISFWQGVGKFLLTAFGLETGNSYMAVLSFFVLSLVFATFAYLLNRKAIVKE